MIQRIQSIYLLIAVVVNIVCLCLQIGSFISNDMITANVYNLWTVNAIDGSRVFNTWPLFAILIFSSAIGIYTIFMYSNRIVQARFCVFNSLLIIGWYILYAVFAHVLANNGEQFSPAFAAILPIVSLIGFILARRGIIHDEKMVRAADRIR